MSHAINSSLLSPLFLIRLQSGFNTFSTRSTTSCQWRARRLTVRRRRRGGHPTEWRGDGFERARQVGARTLGDRAAERGFRAGPPPPPPGHRPPRGCGGSTSVARRSRYHALERPTVRIGAMSEPAPPTSRAASRRGRTAGEYACARSLPGLLQAREPPSVEELRDDGCLPARVKSDRRPDRAREDPVRGQPGWCAKDLFAKETAGQPAGARDRPALKNDAVLVRGLEVDLHAADHRTTWPMYRAHRPRPHRRARELE